MGNSLVRVNGKLYEVLGPLDEGGFAHVYAVQRDGHRFALKWTRGVTEGEQLQRLLLEIQVQRKLQHANALPLEAAEVRKSSDGEKEALMLFPLATRGSLQSLLEQAASRHTSAFTETETLGIFAKLLDAVAALHSLGFAHRDLKPGNVLVGDGEVMEPLLMDFGSVAALKVQLRGPMDCRKLWEDAATYSSAPYRAPELWESGVGDTLTVVDGRADVWSLGCVLYAMAFGPFSPFEHPRDGVQRLAIVNGYVGFPHGNMHFGQVFSATFTALIKWILTPDVVERPTLEGVRLCVNQLVSPAPRKQPSVKMKTMLSRKLLRTSVEGKSNYQEPSGREEDWADFSTFEKPRSTISQLSFSDVVRSRSSSSYSKPPLSNRSSNTQILSVNRAQVSSIIDGNCLAPTSGDREPSDLNRRRALSHTGKKLWVSALDA